MQSEARDAATAPAPAARVLVVHAPLSAPDGALELAAQLASAPGAHLTVVALALQDTDPARCVVGTPAYNRGVREDAAQELRRAREQLAQRPGRTRFKLLVEGRDPPLGAWAAAERFDVIVLGAHRGLQGRGMRRLADSLRRETQADVRVLSSMA
jgi:nucleotide-binding universal stress UspA family protein